MNLSLIAAATLAVVIGVELARRRLEAVAADGGELLPDPYDVLAALAGYGDGSEPSQLPDPFEQAAIMLNPSTYTPDTVPAAVGDRNARAFLDMIASAEGTAGPDGYRTMFGYRYFDSFADHPRQYFDFTDRAGRQLRTSAAGRYQFIVSTWDTLQRRLGLPDFGPDSQDAAALELIRERGALADVRSGRIESAIGKVRKVWASLPGAGYAQPERSLSTLLAAYRSAGGIILS